MEEKSYHHSLKYVFFFFLFTVRLKNEDLSSKLTTVQENTIMTELPFFFLLTLLGVTRKERVHGRRREWVVLFGGGKRKGSGGLFVCTPHPLDTQSGLYCILQIYTQDVGLECFPEKKKKKKKGERERERERRSFFFFQVSVCFHEQEWLRHTNKPLFPGSQMQGPSSDLRPTPRHICTFL